MENKSEYGIFGWILAAAAITAGALWLVALILAPAALIKFCWAFLAA